jgi:hypothetical protein
MVVEDYDNVVLCQFALGETHLCGDHLYNS